MWRKEIKRTSEPGKEKQAEKGETDRKCVRQVKEITGKTSKTGKKGKTEKRVRQVQPDRQVKMNS